MALVLSQKIRAKLSAKVPPVSENDIKECFANRTGRYLIDNRADNATNPPTNWFIAETDYGRWLKICFVRMPNTDVHIKTAYVPNAEEVRIYKKFGENT